MSGIRPKNLSRLTNQNCLKIILHNFRALILRLRKHQAICRNHSAVVDHLATGLFKRVRSCKSRNTQRNTYKRKIAKSLFLKNHSTVESNKSLLPLSICKS